MATYSVAQAKEQLEDLLAQAERGEEVVIAPDQGVRLKIIAADPQPGKQRRFGRHKGLFTVPDEFLDPLTDEELEEWERPL